MGWDQELEDFKQKIDLRAYAADQGYSLDRWESWRGSAVMRTHNDKIVIKVDQDGHYVYFSVRDDRDNGSIIDFIQFRKRLSLGNVRRELRPWLGRAATSLPAFLKLDRTPKDRLRVEQAFRAMAVADRHPYLENQRGLSPALLASHRIVGRVRIDGFKNAVFPHFDTSGLCGFELKNVAFTGFSPGGEKGLWLSHTTPDDQRLVFAEGAIDALSYAGLFPDPASRYASIGGMVNPKQLGLIRALMLTMPINAEIVSAMDNDVAGGELSTMIEASVHDSGRQDLRYRKHTPAQNGYDWNDVLRQSQINSFPAARL